MCRAYLSNVFKELRSKPQAWPVVKLLLAFHATAVKAVFLRFLKGVDAWVAVYFFWFGHGCVASS